MRALLSVFFLFAFASGHGQDSLKFWSFDDFLAQVRTHHPQIKAAEFRLDQGEAALLYAKGNLDPKLKTQLAQKYYDGSQYYDLGSAGLQIPTWVGIDFDLNYFSNDGVYLNPQNKVPNEGLVAAGVSLPVGRGLFFDERRLAIKGAKITARQAEQEKNLMINEVLFEAALTYWGWSNAYQNLKVYEESLELAQQRYAAVKDQAKYGDKPDIDTLEAYIQVQNRLLDLSQGELDFRNATAAASVFLWGEGFIPLEFSPEAVPTGSLSNTPMVDLSDWVATDSFLLNHPIMIQNQLKIDQLLLDQKWKRELFKPKLDLKYQALQAPIGDWADSYNINNYTWGFKFELPLYYRKERGGYRLTKAKLGEQRLIFATKQKELEVKLLQSLNSFNTYDQQLQIAEQLVSNRSKLLAAEREIFENGESSLFLINSREMNYVKAKLKYNDLAAKIWMEFSKVQFITANWR